MFLTEFEVYHSHLLCNIRLAFVFARYWKFSTATGKIFIRERPNAPAEYYGYGVINTPRSLKN